MLADLQPSGRAAEEPEEVDVYGAEVEEEGYDDGAQSRYGLDVPWTALVAAGIPSEE